LASKRSPRALVLGLPYFGRILVAALRERGWEAQYLPHPGRSAAGWARVVAALARADILYLISARVERRAPLANLMRIWRRPVVIHWVGSDVLNAQRQHEAGQVSPRVAERAIHWADAPWLVEELAAMGMRAEMVRLPVPTLGQEPPPLPERFTSLLYLPVAPLDRKVFEMETILALPAALPDVHFILVPSPPETLPQPLPPNLEARSWETDMESLYREVTVLTRLVKHDGMSFMALEALSRGRYVIYGYKLPGVRVASGLDEVVAALRELKERHDAGGLPLNEPGAAWVREAYDATSIVEEVDHRLRKLAGRQPRRKT
jgi:hypothetical protein